jgi:hypothetical protein
VNRKNKKMYVRDIVAGKFYPDELYKNTIMVARQNNARIVGIEVTSLNEFIKTPFLNEMMSSGFYADFVELKARRGTGEYADANRGKEGRVAAMVNDYRQGRIYHNKSVVAQYEQQLLSFPRSKRWDVMDAAAYIIEIIEMKSHYFMPPEMEDDYDIEKEYSELEAFEEPRYGRKWRVAP